MTLAIHHALRTSERATRATQFIRRFQTAARLNVAFRSAKGRRLNALLQSKRRQFLVAKREVNTCGTPREISEISNGRGN